MFSTRPAFERLEQIVNCAVHCFAKKYFGEFIFSRKFSENNYGEKKSAKTIIVTYSSGVYTGGGSSPLAPPGSSRGGGLLNSLLIKIIEMFVQVNPRKLKYK